MTNMGSHVNLPLLKIEVKLSLRLNKHPAMKTCGGVQRRLDGPPDPKRVGECRGGWMGPQIRSERGDEERNTPSRPLLGIEPRSSILEPSHYTD
jgi:hypothetical protein